VGDGVKMGETIERRSFNPPGWMAMIIAVAIPSIGGFIAAGQVLSRIDQFGEQMIQLQGDRARIDGRAAVLENVVTRTQAQLEAVIAEQNRRSGRLEKLEKDTQSIQVALVRDIQANTEVLLQRFSRDEEIRQRRSEETQQKLSAVSEGLAQVTERLNAFLSYYERQQDSTGRSRPQ
jgi:hypothetical protein